MCLCEEEWRVVVVVVLLVEEGRMEGVVDDEGEKKRPKTDQPKNPSNI